MSNSATKPRQSQSDKPWAIIIPPSFWEYDLNDREKVVFLVLDMIARDDPFCFPSHTTIARWAKKTPRAVRDTLPDLERKGFIRTVHRTSKHSKRTGVIMLRRVNPSTPAADTPELIAASEAALNSRKKGRKATKKWQHSLPEKRQHDVSRRDQRKRLQLEKLSPHVRTLFNDLLGDDPDRALERMRGLVVDISRALPDAPGSEKPQLVDDLAALTLTVLMDHDGEDGNLGAHYEMAKWVQAREVGAANVSEALHNAVESVERGKGKSGSALYRSALEKVRRIDAPEHVVN